MPKVATVSRVDVRSTPRKPEGHSSESNPRSVQRSEPTTRTPQRPPRSLRRPSMLPQISSVSVSQNTPATPLENHKECLATVEELERENGALKRDKNALSERIRELEGENQKLQGENQKLLNHQHQLSHLLSRTNDIQRFVGELRDTVASWQQRLQDPVHPPNHSDPVAMSTALPAATSLQDMWDAQEEGAGVFNGSDVLPGSDNFTQLFEI